MNGYGGMCMSGGEGFLRNDKWQIKLLNYYLLSEFFPIYIQPFMNDSNLRNNNL